MKIVSVIGARPQFVKAAAVSRALRAISGVTEYLVHTGQHFDENMSRVFFDDLDIPHPDCNLGIASGLHGQMTGRMLEAIEGVLLDERPNWMLVYGDTNSTLAGALAASKLHIPVAHVEAGLRSFNRRMPEEINRVMTDHLAVRLFAPTSTAVANLTDEGIPQENILLVGDVMYDVARYYSEKAEQRSTVLADMGLQAKCYVLATVHRAENTDDTARLGRVFDGLERITATLPVVLPLHPRTRAALEKAGRLGNLECTLSIIPPVGYLDMVMLERNAAAIVSDSGGVQKEAFFYQVPCVTIREETEWVELVAAGWNTVVPPTQNNFAEALVTAVFRNAPPEEWSSLYGTGETAQAIASNLVRS